MADTLELKELEKINGNFEKAASKADEALTATKTIGTKQAEMVTQLTELNSNFTKAEDWRKEYDEANKKNQDALNSMIVEMKTIREGGGLQVVDGSGPAFNTALAKALKDNKGEILKVTKGRGFQMDLSEGTGLYNKAASNMTTAGNLTGSPVISYLPTPVILPRQAINVRDLVPAVQTATGLITLFRENGLTSPQEGAIAAQTTQGALKEQIGYDFTNVQFTAEYISGFVRISKQMLQDLPFLQSYLPQMLLRDYYKRENAIFVAALINAALGTNSAGGNDAETFINDIALLETNNFTVNGIVTTPTVWGKILKTGYPSTATSYSVPGGFTISANGDVMIAGIPVIKASWMPSGDAIIGDWSQAQVATVDGLKVEFFEQDSDNVQRNLITVRVECRCVFITGQPYAFTVATSL
jgi:HK97 family phage major capsid protein